MYSFAGPADVKGKYQKLRDILQPLLIVIFLVTPWLKTGGKPVLLFDFFNRHFIIFGTSFFSHDAPLLFFLAIILALAIFLVTALYGRLWCGWACPQTVFIHAVFNQVEKWIMGPYAKRTLLYRAAGGIEKNLRMALLGLSFLTICWVMAHSFVAYFLGADVVTAYIIDGPFAHAQGFIILMIMTAVLFFNFVIFREKFCRSVCPYGRFQNTLIDTNTVVVFYNALRGEPRGKKTAQGASEKGDCVGCNRCVTVCPVKIDIRQGFQQECLACAKCIDACNEVMQKTKQPPYLIRYETGDGQKITLKRFRLVLYAGLLVIFTGALIWNLRARSEVDFGISRSPAQPFSVRLDNGKKIIQNQFQLHLKNQTREVQHVSAVLSQSNLEKGFKLLSAASGLTLEPEQDLKTPAFIEIEEAALGTGSSSLQLILQHNNSKSVISIDFVGVE